MEVKISGHTFEYDITGMCLLFFPGQSVKPVLSLRGEKWLSSRLVLTKNGKVARATYRVGERKFHCQKKAIDETKEGLLAAVKYSVFQVFHKATGILPPWGILTGIKPTGIYRRLLEQMGEKETRRFLIEEYCMQPEKVPLLHQICKVMETVKTDPRTEASLYISIPFCPSRCSYCSFVSVATEKSYRLIEPYLERLGEEIRDKVVVLKKHGLSVKSIYVGGGTPGILNEEQTERLLKMITKYVEDPLAEFTFELGRPDTVTDEKLSLLKNYGVTRVCINTQTTNDDVLMAVGRKHTRAQYLESVEKTKKLGFKSINTDLIAGLPGESEASFAHSLEDVLSVGVDNITIHTLSIKKSSRLHEDEKNFDPVNIRVQRMLDRAYARLLSCGYVPYYMYRQKNTVSNGENIGFAKSDTIGLYNLYMMEDLHTVAACGAGASSKLIFSPNGRIERIINVKYPFEYLNENDRVRKNTELLDQMLEERL